MNPLIQHLAKEFERRGWPEQYAKHKSAAGQQSLFKEEDHPRNEDGEFARKGTGAASSKSDQPKQVASLAGQKDLFGGQTAAADDGGHVRMYSRRGQLVERLSRAFVDAGWPARRLGFLERYAGALKQGSDLLRFCHALESRGYRIRYHRTEETRCS